MKPCTTFHPLVSEINGPTKHCRDCGQPEAAHTRPAYDWIFLASDEWGSDFMREVAMEHFAAHPELDVPASA